MLNWLRNFLGVSSGFPRVPPGRPVDTIALPQNWGSVVAPGAGGGGGSVPQGRPVGGGGSVPQGRPVGGGSSGPSVLDMPRLQPGERLEWRNTGIGPKDVIVHPDGSRRGQHWQPPRHSCRRPLAGPSGGGRG